MAQRIERKHRRIRARSVTARVRAGDVEITGELENLSQSGLFVRTDELLFEGAKVQVELLRTGKRALTLPATVADMLEGERAASLGRKNGLGLSFDPLTPDLEQALTRLLRELSGMTQPPGGRPAIATPIMTPMVPPAPAGDGSELQRLRAQVRGLLIDVSDLKRSVAEREKVIEQQRQEIERLRGKR